MRDKDKLRKFQREWLQARRQEWLTKNGPCKKCGSWEKLEVDHIDPKTRASHRVWSWTEDKRNAELSKCQVLCKKCHLAKTSEDVGYPLHSSNKWRTKKCDCNICYEAYKSLSNNWKKKLRSSQVGKAAPC